MKMKVAGLYPYVAQLAPTGGVEALEPVGLQSVLTQAVKKGCEVELFTLLTQTESELVESVRSWSPDILAISAMTPQMPEALKLTKSIKVLLPEVKVVFGGYHPSIAHIMQPELITESLVDIWVRGEGEQTFAEILDSFGHSRDLSQIEGITFSSDGEVVTNPNRRRVTCLDEYSPIWRPSFVKDLRNNGMSYPAPSEQTGFASIEHSRGCLGGCEFCASPEVFGRMVSFRSPENVAEEIRFLSEEKDINNFFFTDLDFIQRGQNNQEKVVALLKEMARLEKPVYWECLGRIRSISDTGNFGLLELMYQAGCRKISWGLESIDPEILISIGKGRHKEDDTFRVLAASESAGIFNTAFYIIGWHDFESGIGDNREKILSQTQALPSYPIHRIRVTIGTPLPGSKFYTNCKEKGLLTTEHLEDFDTNVLVYSHPSLSNEEVQALRQNIYKTFYGSREYSLRMQSMVKTHPEYKKAVEEFMSSAEMRIVTH